MGTANVGHGIVVGIDGSDSALDAARWAACVARRLGEPIDLVHVHPPTSGDGTDPSEEAVLTAAEAAVRGAVDRVEVRRSTPSGKPDRVLTDLSREARMIVLGHTTTTEWESMIRRSDVVSVANHAECPVVTWRSRDGFQPPDGRPVVVGVDGTEVSEFAVEHAFATAAALEAPLVAIHTWTEQSTLTYGEGSRFTDWTAYVEHRREEMKSHTSGHTERFPDVAVSYRVERGKPDIVLLEESKSAQLVVVGSHGRSPLAAAVVGSSSQGLIHHSCCPVMICRAHQRSESEAH
ncbi:universal stress protein [Rhodococcus pyridinivorans]|uniref:universal stress protein n=1 Tax=Rhodococcus TaxID=1827 RepID=UPI0009031C87|nr:MULTISPECIES: universal stress protein [Rhodococcus]APE09771.1 Usp family protein [Rhodococcus sp. 2G]UVT24906.1 universal stress protein [Rhodococcus pyridinivorans]